MHPDKPFAGFIGDIARGRFLVKRTVCIFDWGHLCLLTSVNQIKIEGHS
jgi:hypothetical protein